MAKPPKYVTRPTGSEGTSSVGRHVECAGRSWQDDIEVSVACLSGVDFGHGADVPGSRDGDNW